MEGYHESVLLNEVIEALRIRDAWYLDATLGDGGHLIEIVKRGGKVVGIDVDPQALGRAQKRFKELGYLGSLGKRIKLIQGNFRDIKNLLHQQTDIKDQKFAGCIFDLGVSSLQLEDPERGFSFAREGPLDMRMDPTLSVRALDLVNAGGRKELDELFKTLGEEKYSGRLAAALVRAREVGKVTGNRLQGTGIQTTRDLAELVERVIGRKKGRIHPATKVFQALRIAVNDELNALPEGLDQVIDLIQKNGRIVVISFHSLEDRIVKNTFRQWQDQGVGQVLTKKPITPKEEEVRVNPRSRSAKLRVFRVFRE
ncbi:16S rRNA (cytosine(1402)-N(4))-methyltransferase RsmH [Candidatus Daviesbacteria bacterium]|nr:16S rRNA (cytosine(1402)-N(4))-methyltransferase RsmH [Candidatus Daviesbacteria bacterium]